MQSSGLRLLQVLVMDRRDPEHGVYALPYYSWTSSFEHAILEELMSELGEPGTGDCREEEEPEGILLHTLAPVTVDRDNSDRVMTSSRLPAVVADVAVQAEAATTLLEQAFAAMFPANIEGLTTYVSAGGYDEAGEPDILDLFSVVVLSGHPNYSQRRVLYEGGVLLEDLVAADATELEKVHEGLHKRVEKYFRRGVGGEDDDTNCS